MKKLYRYLTCATMICALGFVSTPFSPAQAQGLAADTKASDVHDPYEDTNRKIHKFNDALDKAILKPVAKGYRAIVPKTGREGIGNFLKNLTAPVTFINAVLQGDLEQAATTFWRFTVNTTLGAAGIMDVASSAGMPDRTEDFGQTLGVHGTKSGAYIVLPFFGPSTTRDVFGKVVDMFTNPFHYMVDGYTVATYKTADIIHSREVILDLTNEIDRTSLDPYATIRSLYLQRREDMVRNGSRVETSE